MRLSTVLLALFRFLLPPVVIGLVYLYTYPFLTGCAFPVATPAEASCQVPGSEKPGRPAEKAPLRFLALGDPQLEGDTSLPDQSLPNLERVLRSLKDGDSTEARVGLGDVVKRDVPRLLQGYRKKLDLWGNDLYLAHIFATVKWWTQPTDVVVLGDLLGSQWIGDEEFDRRANRFWGRVFKGSRKVDDDYILTRDLQSYVDARGTYDGEAIRERKWDGEVMCVAGNHDVGYAGDLDEKRIKRFERRFGPVNWVNRYKLPKFVVDDVHHQDYWDIPGSPELRVVVLNSMNLDEPAYRPDLRAESLRFLDHHSIPPSQTRGNNTATLILTHIPLHKPSGVCVDEPFFSFFPPHEGGGIREQNHLSEDVSQRILDNLGEYSSAFVLNGHDHEGCDTYHHRPRPSSPLSIMSGSGWEAQHSESSGSISVDEGVQGVREVTVRSMMGSFGGNAGLLSAWFDEEGGRWRFEYDTCVFGVQHIWWAIHVLVLVEVGLGVGGIVGMLLEERRVRKTYKMKDA